MRLSLCSEFSVLKQHSQKVRSRCVCTCTFLCNKEQHDPPCFAKVWRRKIAFVQLAQHTLPGLALGNPEHRSDAYLKQLFVKLPDQFLARGSLSIENPNVSVALGASSKLLGTSSNMQIWLTDSISDEIVCFFKSRCELVRRLIALFLRCSFHEYFVCWEDPVKRRFHTCSFFLGAQVFLPALNTFLVGQSRRPTASEMVAWWQSRHKQTALERREQRHRADARLACGLLLGLISGPLARRFQVFAFGAHGGAGPVCS